MNSGPHLEAGPLGSKQTQMQAGNSRNENVEFSHDLQHTHTYAGNSRNENTKFSHDCAASQHIHTHMHIHTHIHTHKPEIAATKTRNFHTVGGHFSCMKKRQNTSFSKENSEQYSTVSL